MEHIIYGRCEIPFFVCETLGFCRKEGLHLFLFLQAELSTLNRKKGAGKVTPFVRVVPIGSVDVVDGGSLVVSMGVVLMF